MGNRVSGKVADQTKGGFLDDVDVEIVGAEYNKSSFDGNDGETVNKTQATIEYQIEGREEPFKQFYSIGNSENVAPFSDEECDDEVDEGGQYLGGANGKELKGVNEGSAWGKFQAALVTKCKFPDTNFDMAISDALVGLRGHMTTIPGGMYKKQQGRPIAVFQSIEKDSIPGKKAAKTTKGKLGPAPAGKVKPAVTTTKKAKATEPEPEPDADENDLETAVGEAISKAIKKAPLPKGQLAQRVGKAFEGEDNRAEAVKLAMSDKFLKAGAEAELWSYDGRMVSEYEAETEDADDAE